MTKSEEFDREASYGQFPSFARMLSAVRSGEIDAELTSQLRNVVEMVAQAFRAGVKKPGSLVIKVTVDPITSDQVALGVESQAKGPKLPPNQTILFVDEQHALATQNPYAYRLPLEDMTELPAAGETVDLTEDQRMLDPDTGEVF